jgi:hypothetical protein
MKRLKLICPNCGTECSTDARGSKSLPDWYKAGLCQDCHADSQAYSPDQRLIYAEAERIRFERFEKLVESDPKLTPRFRPKTKHKFYSSGGKRNAE